MKREEAIAFFKDMNECTYGNLEAVEMAIKALEAPPNDNWYGYSKRLWKNAYERGRAEAEQKWIPVSERLPEVDVDVLVTDNGGGVPTVIIDACGMKDDTGERFWYISQTPVAWMEWPEPYKAESEDKLDGDPVDIDKAVKHYEGTLEMLKGIDLEVDK